MWQHGANRKRKAMTLITGAKQLHYRRQNERFVTSAHRIPQCCARLAGRGGATELVARRGRALGAMGTGRRSGERPMRES